jgi:hypothetical protein
MFYLIIENLGKKKCIDTNAQNIYEDDQFYNCLKNHPFKGSGKKVVGKVKIRCVSDPGNQTEATIYSD